MKSIGIKFFFVAFLCFCPSISNAESCSLRKGITQLYLSDTHLGMGGQCQGKACRGGWHVMEDFRWNFEFSTFLKSINTKYPEGVDLVVVGDMLELWQRQNKNASECGIPSKSDDLGCNKTQAIERLNIIANSHKPFFETLDSFAGENTKNRIIIVPGNHDAALVMSGVNQSFKSHFSDSTQPKICVDSLGIIKHDRIDVDILIEHGHQIEGDLNRFPETSENGVVQCIDISSTGVNCNQEGAYILRSWGENFVQKYFDIHELDFPIIDNYSYEPSGVPNGVSRGLSASSITQKSTALTGLISFMFAEQSYKHVVSLLGKKDNVQAQGFCNSDKPLVNGQTCFEKKSFLAVNKSSNVIQNLPRELKSYVEIVVASYGMPFDSDWKVSDIYSTSQEQVADLDIFFSSVCLYWKSKSDDLPVHCKLKSVDGDLGAIAVGAKYSFLETIVRKKNLKIFNHMEMRFGASKAQGNPRVFIYGHTHKAAFGHDKRNKNYFVNTGAWQRVASSTQIEKVLKNCPINDRNGEPLDEDECFKAITPSELPPCYSYVVHTSKKILPELRWWFYNKQSDRWSSSSHIDRPTFCE